jgi:hypothetical protein
MQKLAHVHGRVWQQQFMMLLITSQPKTWRAN